MLSLKPIAAGMRAWPLFVTLILLAPAAHAQPGEMGETMGSQAGGMCPMMQMGSGGMIGMMVLAGLLVVATIAALIALTVFLVRRSKR